MPQNFKNFIFTIFRWQALLISIILLLFVNITPIQAEEKAVPEGLSTAEWLECLDQVVNEFNPPIKACIEKNGFRYYMCDKIISEQNEAADKEMARRCVAVPKGKSPSPNPTEQPTQDQSTDNNPSIIPNYTQALIIKQPKESDFQKIPKSDFKKVAPVSTASATQKPATESANLTGTTFVGKVDGDGTLILQLPDGKEIELKDDKTAIEVKRPNGFRFRDFNGPVNNYTALKRHFYIKEVNCHILLEQERRDQESLQRFGGIIRASDWSLDDTFDIKPIGDCSYLNNGGPVRISAGQGQVTFKTPGGVVGSAENADFGIGYNAKSDLSVIEIYNGSITVTNRDGNSKTISTTYGSEIKQVEVDKNGVISEKIAVPQSQWEAFLASKQEKKNETKSNTLPIAGVVAILGLGGIVFFLYRTGKLLPFFKISKQKITDILGKINREKKTD